MNQETTDEKEASTPQPRRRRKWLRNLKNKTFVLIIPFVKLIEDYCIHCMKKDEVIAIVHMLETIIPRDGPPEIRASINRMKKYWDEKEYGVKIIREGDIIQGDKNDFRKGSKMTKMSLKDLSEMNDLVGQIKGNSKYDKKRKQKGRPQCVSGRKHDDKVLSE